MNRFLRWARLHRERTDDHLGASSLALWFLAVNTVVFGLLWRFSPDPFVSNLSAIFAWYCPPIDAWYRAKSLSEPRYSILGKKLPVTLKQKASRIAAVTLIALWCLWPLVEPRLRH